MKKVTYPTDDGGAIHEYTKEKKMGEEKLKVGKLFMKDLKTGETFEFDGLKPIELDTAPEPAAELEESVSDGIIIHITGAHVEKIHNVDISIYMKEEE